MIEDKIEEIMKEAFDDVLDRYAPKQPNGSIERKIGLIVGAEIIAKTLIALPTLIQEEKEKEHNKGYLLGLKEGVELSDKVDTKPDTKIDKVYTPSIEDITEIKKKFTAGLDEVFEDSQSYVGVMSTEDHLFESVLSFTWNFFEPYLKG